jgi:hypothetical protein
MYRTSFVRNAFVPDNPLTPAPPTRPHILYELPVLVRGWFGCMTTFTLPKLFDPTWTPRNARISRNKDNDPNMSNVSKSNLKEHDLKNAFSHFHSSIITVRASVRRVDERAKRTHSISSKQSQTLGVSPVRSCVNETIGIVYSELAPNDIPLGESLLEDRLHLHCMR